MVFVTRGSIGKGKGVATEQRVNIPWGGSADQPFAYFFRRPSHPDETHLKSVFSFRDFLFHPLSPASLFRSSFLRVHTIPLWLVRKIDERCVSSWIRRGVMRRECVGLSYPVARKLRHIFSFFSIYERRERRYAHVPAFVYARGWIFNSENRGASSWWFLAVRAVIYASVTTLVGAEVTSRMHGDLSELRWKICGVYSASLARGQLVMFLRGGAVSRSCRLFSLLRRKSTRLSRKRLRYLYRVKLCATCTSGVA